MLYTRGNNEWVCRGIDGIKHDGICDELEGLTISNVEKSCGPKTRSTRSCGVGMLGVCFTIDN